jgi:hypothetical protein
MNLFRSEEHVRNWTVFVPGTEQGIVPLQNVVKPFSGNLFRKRREPAYVSNSAEYVQEFLSALAENGPFWSAAPKAQAA